MKKSFLILLLFSFSICLSQKKRHPNNPNVFISDKKTEKWRVLSKEKKYLEAASELIFLTQKDSTRNSHLDNWHIGQMYAFANDYEKAIFYMNKSAVNIKDENWIWYYKGTIAFLKRDKVELKKFTDLLNSNHSEYYENNSKVLNNLLQNFELSYREAY